MFSRAADPNYDKHGLPGKLFEIIAEENQEELFFSFWHKFWKRLTFQHFETILSSVFKMNIDGFKEKFLKDDCTVHFLESQDVENVILFFDQLEQLIT